MKETNKKINQFQLVLVQTIHRAIFHEAFDTKHRAKGTVK